MKFLKSVLVAVLGVVFLVFSTSSVSAADYMPSASPSPTPVAAVNTFDLFWPIVPGKVEGDSLYFLKTLKEKVRGLLIFGTPQKADYFVFISTKRAVEADQLLKDGKTDLASKTLDNFLNRINYSESLWQKAKASGDVPQSNRDNISKQLTNLDTLFKYLSSKNSGDIKSKIDASDSKVQEFLKAL